jgi:aryl-alcohol dehydrogenase-like predicted oxidoreductase
MKSLSSLCFGCEPLGGTDVGNLDLSAVKKAIHIALDLGVNFFDTAGVYGLGLSEKRLSAILGNRRKDLVIATKGGLSWEKSVSGRSIIIKNSSPTAIRKDVESSLRRLRLDCLPIFFVHWPDIKTPIEDTFVEVFNLQNEGKIQFIGCSNFSAEQIQKACSISKVDYLQLSINLFSNTLNSDISDICERNGIKVIAYNILANGLLTGKLNKNSKFKENDRRSRLPLFKGVKFLNALKKVKKFKIKASENNSNLLNYSINWALKKKNVYSVIIGIKNPKQIKQNWFAINQNKILKKNDK